ncbi:MAG: lytic murein transglycosylase, partial [Patescibacteria group bacterium]|nr:lytic murein transglycosylase [Patescibacteria group bacterium]
VTQELGINPDITPVSCPMRDAKGNQIGWGGAMGPAQFIPSTWMGYRERIVAVSGRAPANPWDIRDAFIAAALYLKNAGAVAGNEQSEWAAAMRYFSGSTNPRFRFYGDNVLALARRYEEDIKALGDQ